MRYQCLNLSKMVKIANGYVLTVLSIEFSAVLDLTRLRIFINNVFIFSLSGSAYFKLITGKVMWESL